MKDLIFDTIMYSIGMILAMLAMVTAFGVLIAMQGIDFKATILGAL